MKKIIVGLGNPGNKYAKTRHNIGWIIIDRLAMESAKATGQKINWQKKNDWSALVAEINNTLLVKPQTMMNDSGRAVQAIIRYYNLLTDDLSDTLLVIHDELDLPIGTTRWSTASRSAGHRGVQSIINHLGTQKFSRYRLGIQPADKPTDASDYVLKKLSTKEWQVLQNMSLQAVYDFINS